MRLLHTVFHSNCINLHSHQQYKRVLFSPHPHQNLLFFVLLIIAFWTGVKWHLIVVLICISLKTSDAEHLFVCLLPSVLELHLYLSWSSKTFTTWCEEPTHWKRPRCWERLRTRGEGSNRGWDGWMASLTQWTWVWATAGDSEGQGSLAWCSSWGLRVRHNLATQQLPSVCFLWKWANLGHYLQ